MYRQQESEMFPNQTVSREPCIRRWRRTVAN